MTAIAVRLSPALVQAIDHLVAEGRYASRSEAIPGAIGLLLRTHKEIIADRAIGESYRRIPQSEEEASIAQAATSSAHRRGTVVRLRDAARCAGPRPKTSGARSSSSPGRQRYP